jgi:hypothetical protein
MGPATESRPLRGSTARSTPGRGRPTIPSRQCASTRPAVMCEAVSVMPQAFHSGQPAARAASAACADSAPPPLSRQRRPRGGGAGLSARAGSIAGTSETWLAPSAISRRASSASKRSSTARHAPAESTRHMAASAPMLVMGRHTSHRSPDPSAGSTVALAATWASSAAADSIAICVLPPVPLVGTSRAIPGSPAVPAVRGAGGAAEPAEAKSAAASTPPGAHAARHSARSGRAGSRGRTGRPSRSPASTPSTMSRRAPETIASGLSGAPRVAASAASAATRSRNCA